MSLLSVRLDNCSLRDWTLKFMRRTRVLVLKMFGAVVIALCVVMAGRLSSIDAKPSGDNHIKKENRKTGTTDWQSPELKKAKDKGDLFQEYGSEPGQSDEDAPPAATTNWTDTQVIKGYAGSTSINVGETIDF